MRFGTAPTKAKKPRKSRPEQDGQVAIFDFLTPLMEAQGYREFIAFHCPNGGYRTPFEAQLFARMGVMAGVADIPFLFPSGLEFVELKAGKGPQTQSQKDFESRVGAMGYRYTVITFTDPADAVRKISQYLTEKGVKH